jgi:hypothetical protein
MGTSPPSAHAFEVTVNTGPAGPLPPPFAPPGACAITITTVVVAAMAANAVIENIFMIIGRISSLFGVPGDVDPADDVSGIVSFTCKTLFQV